MPVAVTILTTQGYEAFHGRCTEISLTGLGCMVAREMDVGEMVRLEIGLPNQELTLLLRAVVRRRKGLLHGFEFVSMAPEQLEALQLLCQGEEAEWT